MSSPRDHVSVFDIFKIGVGPSSSHTLGPWRAAQRFLQELAPRMDSPVASITVHFYGSLAKTGRGHASDIAVQLGLCGQDPETITRDVMDNQIDDIARTRKIRLAGGDVIPFDASVDIVFHGDKLLPFHPNGIRFSARSTGGSEHEAVYYSVGGGLVVREGESHEGADPCAYPIGNADELLAHCDRESCDISQIVMRNELCWRSEQEIRQKLARIKDAMFDSIYCGCHTDGVLPGGLKVQRRAATLARRFLGSDGPLDKEAWIQSIGKQPSDFQTVTEWVTCFAMAVNEENASLGRIVTAPTCGAAGVVPAVLLYSQLFCDLNEESCIDFLLTAGQIGALFKEGATISGAAGGCQAEIGVASSMAAAALAQCLGATPPQTAEAAEIAMEHHLGLTCDPVGGFVQIPCIERNTMGAMKAIVAAQLALQRSASEAVVSLDTVIRTMWVTAQDMSTKYKETSEGGLATQIAVNVSEC